MCQALCWSLRITLPGGVTNTIFQMRKLRLIEVQWSLNR